MKKSDKNILIISIIAVVIIAAFMYFGLRSQSWAGTGYSSLEQCQRALLENGEWCDITCSYYQPKIPTWGLFIGSCVDGKSGEDALMLGQKIVNDRAAISLQINYCPTTGLVWKLNAGACAVSNPTWMRDFNDSIREQARIINESGGIYPTLLPNPEIPIIFWIIVGVIVIGGALIIVKIPRK